MGFNTFRGDNRTFAVILLAPAAVTSCACCGTNKRGGQPALRSRRGRHDLGRLRPADHRGHADGRAHERGSNRRPGRVGDHRGGRRLLPYRSPPLRTACRLRSRTRRRWPTLRPKHLMEAQSWSATGLTPVPSSRAARARLRHRRGALFALEWRAAGGRPTRQLLSALLVRGCPGRCTPRRRGPPAHHPSHRSTRPHRRIRRGRRPV